MEGNSKATEILDSLMRNLKEILTTKTIVGEPVQAGNATILPVMRVSVGFGAGAGSGSAEKSGTGSGGGGGGGVSITPVGFLVVEDGRAVMIAAGGSKWDWITEQIPELFEKLSKFRKSASSKKDSGEESSANDETLER